MNGRNEAIRDGRFLGGLLLAALLLAAPADGADAAAAGSFLFVAGDVRLTPAAGGNAVRVRRGAAVEPGDTVTTGLRGVAQLRMVDGAVLAVRPGTELRIDAYSFDEPGKEDSSFFSLLSGAFRSITGLIGQRNKDGYRVSTSTATIGIRGSDADIGHDATTQLTAVRTYNGGHVITARDQTGPRATLFTGPGDIALVRPGEPPAFGSTFPFRTTPASGEAGGEGEGEGDAEGGDEQAADGESTGEKDAKAAVAADEGGDAGDATSLAPPPPPAVQLVTSSGQTPLDTVRFAPVGTVVVGADIILEFGILEAGNGSVIVGGDGGELVLLGPSFEPLFVAFDEDDGDSFVFAAAGGVLRNAGIGAVTNLAGTTVANVSWGLWQGDYIVVDDGILRDTHIGGIAFAVGSRVTRPLEIAALGGTAFSYHSFGGTATNEKGALPSSFNVNASGTFLSGPSLGNISINGTVNFPAGSTGWSLGGSGTVRDLINDSRDAITGTGVDLSSTCSTCSTGSGAAHGQFLGERAEGLLLGVSAADSSTGQAVTGVAVMQRIP